VNINTLAKGISVEMRLWRMGAKRYDRAVLRGVFLFGSSEMVSLFKLPEEVKLR
jgi:hypothetical protein